VQQRCRNIDYNTTLEWGADSTRQVMAQTAGSLMFHLDQPPKNNPRSEQMIRVCSAAAAGADWVVSLPGVHSAGTGGWAKSRLEAERHGPAAAWQTTGRPRGSRGERGKLEDQESLGSRAVTCHSATATALLGREPWAGECLKGIKGREPPPRTPAATHAGADTPRPAGQGRDAGSDGCIGWGVLVRGHGHLTAP
jgi:hypothetical protein